MKSDILTPELVRRVVSEFALDLRSVHGPAHWMRVRSNGLLLARHTGANTRVVDLFALFHDSRRENDWTDPDHGPRGGDFAAYLFYEERALKCSDEELQMLITACDGHTHGGVHDDATIGTCWDADRLDLPRVGIIIDPHLLCTEIAQRPAIIHQTTEAALAWRSKLGRDHW